MIPPYLFYQIYLSFLEQNDCTRPKCGELSISIKTHHLLICFCSFDLCFSILKKDIFIENLCIVLSCLIKDHYFFKTLFVSI